MKRIFVEVPLFTRRWESLGFNDDDLLNLQNLLLENPSSGVIMEGTGGIRKIRFAFPDRGKSGSVRVCYVDFGEYEILYLITVFSKDKQSNLTQKEKNILKNLVKQLKIETARRFSNERFRK